MKASSILGSVILVFILMGAPLLAIPVLASAILPSNNNNNNPGAAILQSLTHDNGGTTISSSDMNGTVTSCFTTGTATGCHKMEEISQDWVNTIFKTDQYNTTGHVLEKVPDTFLVPTYPTSIPGYTNPNTYLHNPGTYIVCSNLSPICQNLIVFKNETTAVDLNVTG